MKYGLLLSLLIVLVSGCTGMFQPKVSEADVATKVALLKLTKIPIKTTTNNDVIMATVQTAVPQPSATVTLTITTTNTPTKPATDPVSWLGNPTWRDTFSGSNNFYITTNEHIQFSYIGDGFSMTAFNPDGWHSWSLGSQRIGNFYLEALFRVNGCSGNDKYGLVFRAPNFNEGYFYGLSCDGNFGLIRWDTLDQLIDWKLAPPLHAGPNQANRAGVMARGNELIFYINGEEVGRINDNRYTEGMFGFYIVSYNTPQFNVVVEEITYWLQ